MKIYDDYFRAIRHIESDNPEAFAWKGIDSTGLAEVLEEAEKHGYEYKLNCYEEFFDFGILVDGEKVPHHVREMIFQKKLTPICTDEFDLEDARQRAEEMNT